MEPGQGISVAEFINTELEHYLGLHSLWLVSGELGND
jgi:hypothetical protein